MSITDFLNARIAEDEAVARAAVDDLDFWDSPDTAPIGFLNAFDLIDKYRPARVLAECAAKRAIVASCGMVPGYEYDPATKLRDDALRALAAIFADHPDYSPEWKVEA